MTTGFYLLDHGGSRQYSKVRRNGAKLSGAFAVHTSEAITDYSGADSNAENTAAWMARRTDYGAYHILADADSIVDLAPASYEVWHDTETNNHSLSVSGALQASTWLKLSKERREAITKNMAKAAARKALEAVSKGLLKEAPPARRITGAQAKAGKTAGFYGHGETNPGRRSDPGRNFDWDLFLAEYKKLVGGKPAADPKPDNKPAPGKSTYVTLSQAAGTWGIYREGVRPVVKNIFARLNPAKYGGLTYKVQDWTVPNQVALIDTKDYGRVQIFVAHPNARVFKK